MRYALPSPLILAPWPVFTDRSIVIETDYLAWNQSKANAGSPWNISASNDLSLCHSAVIAPIGGREGGKGRAEREGTD